MGYYTTLTGELTWSRELSEEHLERVHALYEFAEADAEGVYFDYDSGKHYDLRDQARELVAVLAEYGVTAKGTIQAVGEEQPDIWRLVFKDGEVVHEDVKMFWPDGTEYRA